MALAENLLKLEELVIKSCDKMLAIVGKETSGKEVTKKFVYPYLTLLHLDSLSNLTFFYPGSFTLEFPALNTLLLFSCFKLKLFQSEHLEGDPEGSSTSIYKQPVILDLRAIPKLKVLSLDWKDVSALCFRLFTENLPYLDTLGVTFYDLNSDDMQSVFLFEILEKTLNVKKLYIGHCGRPEILLNQNPNNCEEMMLGHLEMLLLDQCHGLNYLFTSSLAMKLIYLEKIKVEKCRTMTRIVERDDASERIKLEKLSLIVLNSLSSLECFYSGSETLQLPSLAQVGIYACPQMKIFSQGSIDVESIISIEIDDDLIFYDDLNMSVEVKFTQR
ncbi:disease resistance protein, partial [Trifolium medium]|nr:disease resistance protein [Trifolium medium]